MDPVVFFIVLSSFYGIIYFFDRFFKVGAPVCLKLYS